MLKFKNISTGLLCSYIGNRSKYFCFILLLLREFADVYPFEGVGVFIELLKIQFYCTACTADCREDGLKALQTDIEVHGNAVIYTEWAHAADRMTYKLKHLIC